MKNLKKRFPVLILAFLIAVMPLAMAVPGYASSDVLTGGQSDPGFSLAYGGDSPLILPLPAPNFSDLTDRQVIIVYSDGLFKLYNFYSAEISGGSVFESYISVSYAGSYSLYFYENGSWNLQGSFGSENTVHINCVSYGAARFWKSRAVSGISGGYWLSVIPGVSLLGVFSVFSGVSSWLGGAVNNMISMFWTAEAGLTPIGVLTVCSLALAVILLLFWLIAGWLKFK